MFRRSFYRGSLCGAVVVSLLGVWAVSDRLHLIDHGVRLGNRLRDAARM